MEKYICPVCGYPDLDEPPRDKNRRPSFDICDCCGIKFGYEDCKEENIMQYRNKWIESNGQWFSKDSKPNNWNMEEQLKNIDIKLNK